MAKTTKAAKVSRLKKAEAAEEAATPKKTKREVQLEQVITRLTGKPYKGKR